MEGWTPLHVESPPDASGSVAGWAGPARLGASPPAGLSPAADKCAIHLHGQIPPFIMTVCCPVKPCSRRWRRRDVDLRRRTLAVSCWSDAPSFQVVKPETGAEPHSLTALVRSSWICGYTRHSFPPSNSAPAFVFNWIFIFWVGGGGGGNLASWCHSSARTYFSSHSGQTRYDLPCLWNSVKTEISCVFFPSH